MVGLKCDLDRIVIWTEVHMDEIVVWIVNLASLVWIKPIKLNGIWVRTGLLSGHRIIANTANCSQIPNSGVVKTELWFGQACGLN